MKKLITLTSAVLLIILLTACAQSDQEELEKVYQDGPPISVTPDTMETAPSFDQTAMPESGEQIVVMKTNMGIIKIRLFPTRAPKTVENFIGLVDKGYYNGLIFHRVIPDFMIQGGDPTGTGMGGESLWGGKFEDEFNPDLKNIRGALSMANSGPNTNGSQFFIVQSEATPWLNNRHSVFSQVFEGMDIVDKIAHADKDANDKPLTDIIMEEVALSTF